MVQQCGKNRLVSEALEAGDTGGLLPLMLSDFQFTNLAECQGDEGTFDLSILESRLRGSWTAPDVTCLPGNFLLLDSGKAGVGVGC